MSKTDYPVTHAIRILRENNINFIPHFYKYIEHGGTRVASESLKVPEYNVIKTLIFENETKKTFLVLMHGNYEVSTKQLARTIGAKHIEPCNLATAQKHTGYIFGGISPLGTRFKLPVYAEKTIFNLDKIFLNAGKQGFLVEIYPADLKRILNLSVVEVAIHINK